MKALPVLDKYGIEFLKEIQQNRFPVLFVDQVLELEPGARATALKAFSYNEWYFQGHFEDEPVVPGFVLLECLTQTFLLTFLSVGDNSGKKTAFLSIERATFKQKIVPGHVMVMKAKLDSFRFGVATGTCTGFVGDEEVCKIVLKVGIPEVLGGFTPRSGTRS